ncbi:MAG: hypothetical protein HC857_17850 [Synechococcales cyanobacterium RU_4_20]|nr:hypothetical protein [Synechococcales cyanobacterium RU_4_20]
MRATYTYSPPRWILGFTAYSAIAVLAFFCILNIQPWLGAAKFLAGDTPNIPLLSSLYGLKILFLPIGESIRWLAANILMLGGIFIWAMVQGIQIAPMWVNRPESLRKLQGRAAQYLKENGGDKSKDAQAAIARLAAAMDKALTQELDTLEGMRVWAYCLELVVCVFHFPIYKDGSAALWSDLLSWNLYPDLLQPREIAMVIIMMGGFEILFRIALSIWGLYKARGSFHE